MLREDVFREMASGEPGDPGDQDAHRARTLASDVPGLGCLASVPAAPGSTRALPTSWRRAMGPDAHRGPENPMRRTFIAFVVAILVLTPTSALADSPVTVDCGDGSPLSTVASVDTLAGLQAPVQAMIGNPAGMSDA